MIYIQEVFINTRLETEFVQGEFEYGPVISERFLVK